MPGNSSILAAICVTASRLAFLAITILPYEYRLESGSLFSISSIGMFKSRLSLLITSDFLEPEVQKA